MRLLLAQLCLQRLIDQPCVDLLGVFPVMLVRNGPRLGDEEALLNHRSAYLDNLVAQLGSLLKL